MIVFDWQPTGRRYGEALPIDAFDDVWAVTFRPGSGWVVIRNRQQLQWKFWRTKDEAKAFVEAQIKELLNDD